jgi:hypothetical protein
LWLLLFMGIVHQFIVSLVIILALAYAIKKGTSKYQ